MCFIITFTFLAASLVFLNQELIPQAIFSGVVASISLIFFVQRIIRVRRCLFGKETDCNKK